MEALCLRIKDVDFEKNSIVARDGKGDKDRITMLPESLKASLQSHDVSPRHKPVSASDDVPSAGGHGHRAAAAPTKHCDPLSGWSETLC